MNKWHLFILLFFALLVVLIKPHFWQRSPVFFYEPMILPQNVLVGDVLVTTYGQQIVFQNDEQVIDIVSTVNGTYIKTRRFLWFWEK